LDAQAAVAGRSKAREDSPPFEQRLTGPSSRCANPSTGASAAARRQILCMRSTVRCAAPRGKAARSTIRY
jgi:hypothetical protein